ncbi:hypothetical protein [Colwellia piezophila]|uniref:hypothetical protein n=1 Tax=Colwellia piezophila TaxID=211668 RepID=UPI00037AEEED|nr:hypothetical protein [Colwellia piezophila]
MNVDMTRLDSLNLEQLSKFSLMLVDEFENSTQESVDIVSDTINSFGIYIHQLSKEKNEEALHTIQAAIKSNDGTRGLEKAKEIMKQYDELEYIAKSTKSKIKMIIEKASKKSFEFNKANYL